MDGPDTGVDGRPVSRSSSGGRDEIPSSAKRPLPPSARRRLPGLPSPRTWAPLRGHRDVPGVCSPEGCLDD